MIDLTPLEVRKKKGDFRRGMRGYEPQAVDDFLDLVADRLEQLVREHAAMTERLVRVEDQVNDYRERERALTEALVTAQEMREEMRKQIEREVELKRREAEADAETIRNEALQIREREEESIRTLRARQSQFLQSYRSFLERELTEIAVMSESIDLSRGTGQPAQPRRSRRRAEPELPIAETPRKAAQAEARQAAEPIPMPLPMPLPMPIAAEPEPEPELDFEPEASAAEPDIEPVAELEPEAELPAEPEIEPETEPEVDDPFVPDPLPQVAAVADPLEKSFDDMLNDLPPFAGAAKVRQAGSLEVPVEMKQAPGSADEEAEVLADVRAEFDAVTADDDLPLLPPEPMPDADDMMELVDDVADDEDEDGWMSTLLEGKGDGD